MRMIWFPTVEGAFAVAVAVTLAWSGWLAINGHVSIGAATTVTLYVVQINDPLDRIVSWLDEIQIGQTALARLVGVSVVQRRSAHERTRADQRDHHLGRRALRLPRGPRRLERREPGGAPGRTARHRRTLRCGQVNDRSPHRRHRRAAQRFGASR